MTVLVIGSGVAGCAAAVAAAEAGADVVLLTADHHLGGVAAAGEHRTLCGLAPIEAAQPTLLEPALVGGWVEAIASGQPYRLGRVWLWPTTANHMQSGLAGRLFKAGVVVLRGRSVTGVDAAPDGIRALVAGRERWPCTAVVDASGCGLVTRLLGAVMAPALLWPAWRGVIEAPLVDGLAGRLAAQRAIRAAWPAGHPATEAAVALTSMGDGGWQLSLDVPPGTTPATAAGWAEHAATALGGRLIAGARMVASRDAGRPAGMISLDAVFACRERGLCWAAWPSEDHRAEGVQWRWPNADRHGVPEAVARMPGGPGNLWLAGRGLAVTAEAAAALRVTGTALAVGAAVGTVVGAGAASLAGQTS